MKRSYADMVKTHSPSGQIVRAPSGGNQLVVVYFTLTVALTESDATGTATVDATSPVFASGATIEVENPPSSSVGGYRYSGAIGAKGQAIIQGDRIIIHNMDCPAA